MHHVKTKSNAFVIKIKTLNARYLASSKTQNCTEIAKIVKRTYYTDMLREFIKTTQIIHLQKRKPMHNQIIIINKSKLRH